jgi:EmrB/QacA subfamily drug resistance transporter
MSMPSTSLSQPASGPDRRRGALAVLALAQLMVVLDATIVNIALPSAQRALGFSVADRQWVVTAYALAFGSLLLLGGRLADIVGRRRMFLTGLAGFAAASAVGGAAGNFTVLVSARAAQGAFGALLAPAALSLLATTFTAPKDRSRAFAVFSAVAGGGAAIGLLLGGILTQYLSWRWCMYVNLLFAAVAFAGGLAVLPARSSDQRPHLNVTSVVTVSAGLFALVFGFSHADTAGWSDAVTLGTLIGGAALLAFFVFLQAKVTHPLLPLRVPLDRNRGGAYLAIFTVGVSIFGVFLYVTYYLQQGLAFTAVQAGLAFLPMTFALAIAAQLSARRLLPRVGPRATIAPGLFLASVGVFWLSRIGITSDYLNLILPATLVFGLGLGLTISASINTATVGVERADTGVASALVNVGQQVGGSIGTSLLNTLAASAAAGFLAVHLHAPHAATLAVLHGYQTGFIWSGVILLVAAVTTGALLHRPAAATVSDAAPAGAAANSSGSSPVSPGPSPVAGTGATRDSGTSCPHSEPAVL